MPDLNVYVVVDKTTGEPVWFTQDEGLLRSCLTKTEQYIEHTEDSFRDKFNGKTLTKYFLSNNRNREAYELEDCLILAPETVM